jgi:acyl-CoA thioester hydrolase
MTSDILPPSRDSSAYSHWYEDKVRFADLDAFGHANNNAIGGLFEAARIVLLRDMGITGFADTPFHCAIARLVMEYPQETHLFEAVRVGQRVARIGNSSFLLHSALFVVREGKEVCTSTCEAVCVITDSKTHRPAPIPPAAREILSRHA